MVSCAALDCQNATSHSSVTFPVPDKALLKPRMQNTGRDVGTPWERLCSDQFEESSLERDPLKTRKNRWRLKDTVPNKLILGQDGNWRVGTPQGSCKCTRKRTQKQIRRPKHWRVTGKFPSGAEGPTLEDWQYEFYKTILKEKYGSSTTFGKDYPVPKSKIPAGEVAQVKAQRDLKGRKIPASLSTGCGGAMIRSQQQSAKDTQVHGSSSGGSQKLHWNVSDKGEILESPRSSTNGANPMGNGRGSSFPAEGQPDGFKQFPLQQQSHPQTPKVPWFVCTECGKSSAQDEYLLQHHRIHSGERPHTCTECEKSFLEKPKLTNHLETYFHIIQVPDDFLG